MLASLRHTGTASIAQDGACCIAQGHHQATACLAHCNALVLEGARPITHHVEQVQRWSAAALTQAHHWSAAAAAARGALCI